MNAKRLLYTLPLFILASCSNELSDIDNSSGGTGRATITLRLGTASISDALTLSGRGPWEDNYAENGEMIKTGCVVMVNNVNGSPDKGKIYKIFRLEGSGTEEYERRDVITIAAERGEYDFYSFANIPEADLKGERAELSSVTIDGVTMNIGQEMPDLSETTYTAAFNRFKLRPASEADYTGIPMSNKETYEVSADATVNLMLYRLLSKMVFDFTNKSGSDLTIENIEMGNVTTDNTPLYLLPPRTSTGIITNRFPGSSRTTATLTLYDKDEADSKPITVKKDDKKVPYSVYINESLSDHASRMFPLQITMRRNGAVDSDVRNAIMKFSALPRNQQAFVPITLTDYELNLDPKYYPPIGGYPTFTMDDTEKYCMIVFAGGGDFTLRPSLYEIADKHNPERWFTLTDKEHVENYQLKVDDPQGLFTAQPAFDVTTGEIIGTLNPAVTSGRATVQLTVQIKQNPALTQIYNRTIYIVRR